MTWGASPASAWGARFAPAAAGRFTGVIAAGLLAVFASLAVLSMEAHGPTFPEPANMAAGYARWRLCGLPLRLLALRPAIGGDEFLYRNLADPDRMLFLARLPSLVFGIFLGGLVFRWAARIGGGAAGILALTAYAFCPAILDHAGLATNDLPGAAVVTAGLYALHRGFSAVKMPMPRPGRWRWTGPAALLFLVGTLPYMPVDVRMLLPVIPFLCVLAGQMVAGAASGQGSPMFPPDGRLRMLVAGFLVAWIVSGALQAGPHFHADDQGQDLKSLGEWYEADQARHGPAELILSYYGFGDPRYYGMLKTQALAPVGPPRNSRHVNSRAPRRELLAISAANLRDRFTWLRDGERPAAIIGRTIFVYDVTARPGIHARLMSIYEALGRPAEAVRERARSVVPRGASLATARGGR